MSCWFLSIYQLETDDHNIWPEEHHSMMSGRLGDCRVDGFYGVKTESASGMSGSWMMLQSEIQISQLLPHFALSTPRMTRSRRKFSKLFHCSGKFNFLDTNISISEFSPAQGPSGGASVSIRAWWLDLEGLSLLRIAAYSDSAPRLKGSLRVTGANCKLMLFVVVSWGIPWVDSLSKFVSD